MTDPIADFLTRIRNANRAGHERTRVPYSKMKEAICRILKDEGFITDFRVTEDGPGKSLWVYLRYGPDKKKYLTDLKRVSRPGLRVYVTSDKVPRVLRGIGIAILSTSDGVMTDAEARKRRVGGEVLCEVW